MFIHKYVACVVVVLWSIIWCSIGLIISDYKIMKKPNYDGTLKPATCDIELKIPKSYCTGADENGITYYYNTVVNRLYLH